MKNSHYKCQQALQLMLQVVILREDSLLFSKLALFEPERKIRNQHYLELSRLEEHRTVLQQKMEPLFEEIEINDFWKTLLFQFSNKVYKHIKNFHMKLNTFSTKIAQITETNAFLQALRNACIQKLAESKNVKQFIGLITERLRERALREFPMLNYFGINNKTIQLARRQESSKNNRFLLLIKETQAQFFFNCHKKAMSKLESDLKRLLSKDTKKPEHPMLLSYQLLQIEDENHLDVYIMQNGMSVNLSYKQEGFCEFITTKYLRMVKDLLSRNSFNDRCIKMYRDRYNQSFRAKKIPKSSTYYEDFQKRARNKSDRIREIQLSSSIQMKNFTNIPLPLSEKVEKPEATIQLQLPQYPKKNAFKIQKIEPRKKSYTLRPLCESKENNKQVVHQKIIQMKLQEQPLQIAKMLRIRKRKHLPIFKDQSGWSIIIKENKSKISFLIH